MVSYRGIIRPFTRGAVAFKWSPQRIMSVLRQNLGDKLDEQYALQQIISAQQDEVNFAGIRSLKKDARPSDRLFKVISPPWGEKYQYTLRLEGVDEFGNKVGSKYISYRSNYRLTRNQLKIRLQDALNATSEQGYSYIGIENVVIVAGYQNARLI